MASDFAGQVVQRSRGHFARGRLDEARDKHGRRLSSKRLVPMKKHPHLSE